MQPGPVTTLIVRSQSVHTAVTSLLREEVRSVDPDLPLFSIMSMDQLLMQSQLPQRLFATLTAIFGSIALVLSAVGVYAITAYAVTRRTQEIGIRMALGAQTVQIWWLVLRTVMAQLAIGLALGLAGAMAVGQLLLGVLAQTGSFDIITLALVAFLLVLVSLAACFVPAREHGVGDGDGNRLRAQAASPRRGRECTDGHQLCKALTSWVDPNGATKP